MPVIRLPDGSTRSFEGPVSVAEVAQSIGSGLARAALAGKVDGRLVDTSHRIDDDAALAIITELRSRAALRGMGKFTLDVVYARAKAKLWNKVERLRALPNLRISSYTSS